MVEIESRKDRDIFFESLGGWNNDDQIGKKTTKQLKKQRRKEEKEARKLHKQEKM